MDINNFGANASLVLERIMSSYGVTTQKALSEATDIPTNTVSNWVQRNSVPSNVILKCSVDTGADARWLVTGELAKANSNQPNRALKGKPLYDKILVSGGKAVLRRILDAYGFDTQKELGDYLNISSGTISTWIRREYFPGDVVICCAIDTGVKLEWLATGTGNQYEDSVTDKILTTSIPKKRLNAGILEDTGIWGADIGFISHVIIEPVLIESSSGAWLIDKSFQEISNGRWLLGIDNKYDIYDVILLPGKKLSIVNNGVSFNCGAMEVQIIGKVAVTLEFNF